MSYFYIDYLDYTTSCDYSSNLRALRLRFDLLVFANDTLILSVPACVKLRDTTALLSKLDPFWLNGRIKLQLDKKHELNPMNYFRRRSQKLETSIDESKLLNHFEYTAYTDPRTPAFFNVYLPEIVTVSASSLYIDKVNDTDKLFREATKDEINSSFDSFATALSIPDNINLTSILYGLEAMTGSNSLFQRAIIEEQLSEKYRMNQVQSKVISTILDRSFATANAKTNESRPISSIIHRLTGEFMIRIMKLCYPQLFSKVKSLSFEQLFQLSIDHDFRTLVDILNALVFLTEQNKLAKICITDICGVISLSLTAFHLTKVLFNLSVDLAKSNYICNDIISSLMSNELIYQFIREYNTAPVNAYLEALKLADQYFHRISENIDNYRWLSAVRSMGQYQEGCDRWK